MRAVRYLLPTWVSNIDISSWMSFWTESLLSLYCWRWNMRSARFGWSSKAVAFSWTISWTRAISSWTPGEEEEEEEAGEQGIRPSRRQTISSRAELARIDTAW